MVNIQHHSLNTKLNNRVLWYDGDSSVSPENLLTLILKGADVNNLYTTTVTSEIEKYNRLSMVPITIKTKIQPLEFDWKIGQVYKQIDVEDFVFEILEEEIQGLEKSEQKKRIERTVRELSLFKKYSLTTVLKLMIFIVNHFEQNNIVWGVGRGSSVSSYVLYLIGIHDIDSVKYNLSIEDFLRSN